MIVEEENFNIHPVWVNQGPGKGELMERSIYT
jgi:hypothetical protein